MCTKTIIELMVSWVWFIGGGVCIKQAAFILCDDWFLVNGPLDLYWAPPFMGLRREPPCRAVCQAVSGPSIQYIDQRRSIPSMMDGRRHFTAEAQGSFSRSAGGWHAWVTVIPSSQIYIQQTLSALSGDFLLTVASGISLLTLYLHKD